MNWKGNLLSIQFMLMHRFKSGHSCTIANSTLANIILFFYFFYCAIFISIAEMMAAGIREEIRRLYRRRQLHFNPHQEVQGDSSSDSAGSPISSSFASTYSSSSRDKPLFTFRQVGAKLFFILYIFGIYIIYCIYFDSGRYYMRASLNWAWITTPRRVWSYFEYEVVRTVWCLCQILKWPVTQTFWGVCSTKL